ncbi:F-box/LRR-repeat protein At5g02910-like isoform X2 [Raphanus sativus]|uniref:F-box/LRR-repeat protein At5g02910 isoform X2 n=1 Tax=Raphanus sativus TaxID=3726 RepID=A0A9W3CMV3_RAPSA|nr:F-box/LRR-repeat protein At5g02910 isoform X2 [Raphanus sativus]XP_056852804.1 F-box/LRR-repeat protein At5g02910-like isoform X2 [Raphanus sativus]
MTKRVESESNGISTTVRSPSHRSRSNGGSDFISSLPDEVLQHILSYIPTEYAVRTSALSKRWKHVWRETPSLSFHCHTWDHHPVSISKTLASFFTAPKLTSFHIHVTFNPNNSSLTSSSHVNSWIELALSREADKISLVIIGSDNVLPDLFFTNSSVKQLRLALGHRGSYDYRNMIPKPTVVWTSLRNLSLECFSLPDESLANILSGCPMLESLVLINCPKLGHLDLSNSPKLTSLNYVGETTRGDGFHQDMVLKMLQKLQNVENLTIGPIVLQLLSVAELCGLPFPQLQAKSLTVTTMVVRSVIPSLARLLQNSPGLQKITLNTISYRGIPDAEFNRHLRKQGLNPDGCWRLEYGDFPTTKQTYSHCVVATRAKSKHVVSFIKLVLQHSKAVDTVVLRLGGYLNATEYEKLLRMVPTFTGNKNVRTRGQGKRLLNVLKITPRTVCV